MSPVVLIIKVNLVLYHIIIKELVGHPVGLDYHGTVKSQS